jgi:hypothetical protein
MFELQPSCVVSGLHQHLSWLVGFEHQHVWGQTKFRPKMGLSVVLGLGKALD